MEPTTNVEASCVAETTGSPNAASALQAQPPVTTEGEGETQGEPEAPPETKKRGRPKGSKNKKSAEEKTVFAMPAPALAPTAGPVKKKRGRSRKNPVAKPAAPLERKKLGRPPGSKNKPKNDPPAAAPISGTEVDITDVSIVLAGANKLDVVESRARREVSRGPRNKRARHVRKSPTPSISQTFNIDTLTSD